MNQKIQEILKWHKETFPDAKELDQLQKVLEETDELAEMLYFRFEYGFSNAGRVTEEFADVFIAMIRMCEFWGIGLEKAIDDKMEVNRQRAKDGRWE